MKRMLALWITLVLLLTSAHAEPFALLDYTDDILDDGSPIYYFRELSLKLPPEWRGKVMAFAEEGGTSFYQISSYEKFQEEGIEGGGFLFMLGASVNNSFSELPSYAYLGFSEESAMNYYLRLPTDYPVPNDDAIRAEYDALYSQIDYVIENASFYSTAEPEENAAAGVTPQQARYHFEHNMLPRYFYEIPERVLDTIKEVGCYALWESFSTENGIDPTYPAGDYVEHWYSAADDTTLLQVEFPEPDANTLCYRVYFIYNAVTAFSG